MTRPLRIFRSHLTGNYYATRSYKVRSNVVSSGGEVERVEITGKKEDVTDQIKAIVRTELKESGCDNIAATLRDIAQLAREEQAGEIEYVVMTANSLDELADELDRLMGVSS